MVAHGELDRGSAACGEWAMRDYPQLGTSEDLPAVVKAIKMIAQIRDSDINDFKNLNKVLVSGRSTTRVPSSSADVIAGDVVGDFCPTATYLYILIPNAGSPVWRRITMGAW